MVNLNKPQYICNVEAIITFRAMNLEADKAIDTN